MNVQRVPGIQMQRFVQENSRSALPDVIQPPLGNRSFPSAPRYQSTHGAINLVLKSHTSAHATSLGSRQSKCPRIGAATLVDVPGKNNPPKGGKTCVWGGILGGCQRKIPCQNLPTRVKTRTPRHSEPGHVRNLKACEQAGRNDEYRL